MANEARGVRDYGYERFLATATVAAYEVIQCPSGKAGYHDSPVAKSPGEYVEVRTAGTAVLKKNTTFQALKGGRAYWDASADTAYYKRVNDRDFYVGRWAQDGTQAQDMIEVLLNEDPAYDIDIALNPNKPTLVGSQSNGIFSHQLTRAKVGASPGWIVDGQDNLPYLATLADNETAATIVIPATGLTIGDVITGFRVVAQVESAGNTVTIDADLRATTNVAAEPTDASIATMAQVSVTADTAVSETKTGLTETVSSGKTYYLLITATTGASCDIILQACEVTVAKALSGSTAFQRCGEAQIMSLSAMNEAQKVDALSSNGFALSANAIIEMQFRVLVDGGSSTDVSIGIASDTHASDADSITEHMFVHLDGDSTNIYIQSEDGTTTVTATDTTDDYTKGMPIANRVEVWFDMRDPADVQVYVNGVNRLTSTVFNLAEVAVPLFLLAHVEKSASTDEYMLSLDRMTARFAEQ